MNMDNELRDALRRKEAPVDLAERVLALARQRSEQTTAARNVAGDATRPGQATSGRSGTGVLRWLAAAAVVTLSVGAAERYYAHQQQVEAARVQNEIRIALQITSEKLALVQRRISDSGSEKGR